METPAPAVVQPDLTPPSPSKPAPKNYSLLSNQEGKEEAAKIILQTRDFNYDYLNRLTPTNNGELMKEARDLVLDEVDFYRQVAKDHRVDIDRTQTMVMIGDRVYDLVSNNGLVFADAAMELLYREKFGTAIPWLHSDIDSLADLEELHSRVRIISLDGGPFYAAHRFITLNRALTLLEKAGTQTPTELVLSTKSYYVPPEGGKIMRLFRGNRISVYHDLAQYYQVNDSWIYQKFLDANPSGNFIDDFSAFVNNGQGFQELIRYFAETEQAEAAQLYSREYNLFASFWRTHFSVNGFAKELVSYQDGDLVRVEDPAEILDASNFGILLRPELTLNRHPSWPYVRNNSLVRMLEENPGFVIRENPAGAVDMVKVEAVESVETELGQVFMPTIPPKIGYMPKKYLGEKIQPPSS